MAARRLLSGRISMFENPVWKKQAALSTRRVSSQSYNGGSKWIAKAFISTATLVGGSVVVLEYIPESQESVDQVFPGFKERYGRSKGKVASWYQKASEYVSSTRQESLSPERAKIRVEDKPLKPLSSKPSTAQPSLSSSNEKKPNVQQDASKTRADANQKKELPKQKSHSATPTSMKEPADQKKEKSPKQVPEKTDKKQTKSDKKVVPQSQPSQKTTAPASVSPAASKETTKSDPIRDQPKQPSGRDAQILVEKENALAKDLAWAVQEYSSVVQSTVQSHRSLADTMEGLSQDLRHAGEQSRNVQKAVIALNAAKEQTGAVQEGFQEAAKAYLEAETTLKSAIQSAASADLHREAEEAKSLLAKLEGKVAGSREVVCNALALSVPLVESVEMKIAQVREKAGLLGTPSSVEGVEQLQMMLVVSQEQNSVMKDRIHELEVRDADTVSQALQLQEDEMEKLAQARLNAALDSQKQAHRETLEQQAFELESLYEQKLREQIKRQLVLQAEEMQGTLDSQHRELSAKYSRELSEKIVEVNASHQLEQARSKAHLQAVDSMIDSISSAGQEVRRQQELRAACETLNKAMQSADRDEEAEMHSFASEFSVLKTAASDDNFIASVLENLSSSVLSADVPSLTSLYNRFDKVKAVCRRVALVPEHGGLGSYLTSTIASAFTFNALPYNTIDGTTPLDQMDMYQLLHQAEAYVNRGDLEMATRCLNQLKGEPRRVARDWLQDARLHLETAQAARVITDYIAASSVSTSSLL